jgi:esterase/lipase superfamily enzyme
MKRAALLTLILSLTAGGNQMTTRVDLRVPPFQSARSELIPMSAGQIVTVIPSRRGELIPAIFLFEEKAGLVAKNDESSDLPTYSWTAADEVKVRVVIYSNSDIALDYVIQVLPQEPNRSEPTPSAPVKAFFPVYFGTNRTLAHIAPPEFTSEPSPDGQLAYGRCMVSIPLDHRMGQLEYPTLWRLEFTPDPMKHIYVWKVETFAGSRFYDDVSALASRSGDDEALVFVHGFSNTFEDSILRTAQLAYDLHIKGPAIAFSWPTHGKKDLVSYNRDQANSELSIEPLRQLLTELSAKSKIKRIHVIAHSMGNRPVMNALSKMGPAAANIRQIALMAPDIDVRIFSALLRQFPKSDMSVALYASSADLALRLSNSLNGYHRAGEGGQNIVVLPGLDSIDASKIDTSLLGANHQYFGDSSTLLCDLFWFFQGKPVTDRFGLTRQQSSAGPYWLFEARAR